MPREVEAVSYLLELLGRGLDFDLADLLDGYLWPPRLQGAATRRESCSQSPSSPEGHFQLGLSSLRSGHSADAAEQLAQACRQSPNHLPSRVALARAHYEAGQTRAALAQLKIAVEIQPTEALIHFAVGLVLEKLSRPADAARAYRLAVEYDPSLDLARERLAAVDLLGGDLEDAIAQYHALRQSAGGDGWTASVLGHLYFLEGQYDQAVYEFQSAIAIEPENWALADDEVEVLVDEGQTVRAIDRLHELIEQQGPFADLYVRLADVYGMTGDDEAAEKHYLKALEIQPTYLEANIKLGTHHLVFGRWEEAAEAFCRASELSDKVLVNYVGLAVARSAAGEDAAAEEALDLAAAVEPNGTLLLSEMARLQLKAALAERFTSALEAADMSRLACLGLDDDDLLQRQISRHGELVGRHGPDAALRFRYGVLLRASGKNEHAIEQFGKAVEICPTHVRAIVRLGIIQRDHGLAEQALCTFRRALDISPEQIAIHYRIGLLYTDRRQLNREIERLCGAGGPHPCRRGGCQGQEQVRAELALSLQNMGLMDLAAATWRSLRRMHQGVV